MIEDLIKKIKECRTDNELVDVLFNHILQTKKEEIMEKVLNYFWEILAKSIFTEKK